MACSSTVFGPETWARARIVELGEEEHDPDGHTHRLTLAIDTHVLDDDPNRRYLAPTTSNVESGVSFGLAHASEHAHWFPALPWVDGWLRESFDDTAATVLRLAPVDVERGKSDLVHHAHYLNLLDLIGRDAHVPEIKLINNAQTDLGTALAVDMVLDIGNSRSFGILVEEHPKEPDGLRWRYELELRDLSRSHHIYSEPFESRIELAQPVFGKENWAARSGRSGAFLWPTIGRIGPEAARLAGARRGTEGATGISSPKRYLWDEDRFQTGWRFNTAYVRTEIEPKAVAAPMSTLINDIGSALFALPKDDRVPVFQPLYSRSAMMTFMLAEVLTHALCQINSAGQRLRMPNANLPRQLRSIILTVPPSMPTQERDIFESRVEEAIGIVWKALGWHPEDDPIDGEGMHSAWPPLPTKEVSWDEATCGQVVYLYNETRNTYSGRPGDFFANAAYGKPPDRQRRLTIATVDIGSGTTDLVINDYLFDNDGQGQNAYIVPDQRFRDGFKIAGDDILLQIIQSVLSPAFERAVQGVGIQDPQPLLDRLMGFERLDVRDSVLRQQLVVQVIYPAGLALLKHYENYDPFYGSDPRSFQLGELVRDGGGGAPSDAVYEFIQRHMRKEQGYNGEPFDAMEIGVPVDLANIHHLFLGGPPGDRARHSLTVRGHPHLRL